MHMADALVSPAVGGAMWVVTTGIIGWCSSRVSSNGGERLAPLMGVMGAFVFAAQMINFAIPGTGSSGHLTGGLLLAILLGPGAAFLTLASILVIQALFFGDGGILALGCNIFNLGFFSCLIAYPFIYRPLAASGSSRGRVFGAAVLAAIISSQAGAFSVVLQTTLSGITELPLQSFMLFMQPIHLAIGLVEGLVTASIVLFLYRTRPELMPLAGSTSARAGAGTIGALLIAALLTGGVLSWFASSSPDGLEWSIMNTAGPEHERQAEGTVHESLARLQQKTTVMPDYGLPGGTGSDSRYTLPDQKIDDYGTSAAGLLGTTLCLLFISLIGLLLKRRRAC